MVPYPAAHRLKLGQFSRHMDTIYNGQKYAVVPDDLESCQLLARSGFDVDTPIKVDYHWPTKYDAPMPHQIVTADFMIKYKRCFCLNDIGTAKTLSILWAADYLIRTGEIKRVLISSPLSTLWRVWMDEIFSNFHDRSGVVLHGPKFSRIKALEERHEFYIINHDGVATMLPQLREKKFDLIIVDEGAVLRNARTDRWKYHDKLAGPKTDKWMWWMTGSPMPKGPEDIWGQVKMINPLNVPEYFTRFRDDMMFKPNRIQHKDGTSTKNKFTWLPRKGWKDRCYAMLQPSIRFARDECINLPDCVTEDRQVEMSPEQKKAYVSMHNHLIIELNDQKITAVNAGVKLMKLVQVACGAVYDGTGTAQFIKCKAKKTALLEILQEAGSKVIVFVPFRHALSMIADFVVNEGYTAELVYGDVSATKRSEIFSTFQDGDLDIIVAHPRTMAHGLNLTVSHTIVWWSPIDDFQYYEQANGRITRPGQTCKQTIVHLRCSEVENRIYQRLKSKEKMQGILLELLQQKPDLKKVS